MLHATLLNVTPSVCRSDVSIIAGFALILMTKNDNHVFPVCEYVNVGMSPHLMTDFSEVLE